MVSSEFLFRPFCCFNIAGVHVRVTVASTRFKIHFTKCSSAGFEKGRRTRRRPRRRFQRQVRVTQARGITISDFIFRRRSVDFSEKEAERSQVKFAARWTVLREHRFSCPRSERTSSIFYTNNRARMPSRFLWPRYSWLKMLSEAWPGSDVSEQKRALVYEAVLETWELASKSRLTVHFSHDRYTTLYRDQHNFSNLLNTEWQSI